MSLLYVENTEDARELVCRLFAAEGVACATAPDCSAALRALKGGGFRVVILDLGMAPIDGLTCGGYMKTLHPELVLVAYTAYSEATHADSVLGEAGFSKCYRKGADELKMIKEVAELCAHGKTTSA